MRPRFIVALVVVGAAVSVYLTLLPARAAGPAQVLAGTRWPVVKGAYHVHSNRSDGTGTIDEIAEAAARAGLQFVIITDHGDGTRAPDPPAYRSGVLCIDAVEVSTTRGHLTALGMPQMPYRLAGEPRAVIEDVQRFGGIAVAAHPGSPRAALRWRDWAAPFDGLEWLNADSEWRDEFWGSLGRVLLTYPVRPAETLATLLDRPDSLIAQWDRAARARHVVGIAGADAHARLGLRSATEPYDDQVLARLPSYEASFRVFVNHAVLNAPLNGDPTRDAHEVLDAIRWGRLITSVEGLARLGGVDVTATGSGRTARPGEYIDSAAGVAFEASIGAPAGTTLVLVRDGTPMFEIVANQLATVVGADPAVYRIEAHLPQSMRAPSIPWLVTNPIYVNLSAAHKPAPEPNVNEAASRTHVETQKWQAEASAGSSSVLSRGTIEDGTRVVRWRLQIAATPGSPYAGISFPLGQQAAAHRGLQLRARADRPMRIWAQLRTPAERGGRRWWRSFYVDRNMRSVDLPFDRFRPAAETDEPSPPPLGEIDSLLLVADTVNSPPGTAATIELSDLWLVK